MSENSLPIQIEVSVDKATMERSFAEIKAKAEATGRVIGESLSKGFIINVKGLKEAIDGIKNLSDAETEHKKRTEGSSDANDKLNATFRRQIDSLNIIKNLIKSDTDLLKDSAAQRRVLNSLLHKSAESFKDLDAAQLSVIVSQAKELQGLKAEINTKTALAVANKGQTDDTIKLIVAKTKQQYSTKKLVDEIRGELTATDKLSNAVYLQIKRQELLDIKFKNGSITQKAYASQINATIDRLEQLGVTAGRVKLATVGKSQGFVGPQLPTRYNTSNLTQGVIAGNDTASRQMAGLIDQARKMDEEINKGFFGRFKSRMNEVALMTTTLTRAFFGLGIAVSAIAFPAVFGGAYLKSLEDAQHGIAANLTAMSKAAGGSLTYSQSSAIAADAISKLSDEAIKYNISLEDIVKTYQAIIGPGMAAGMTFEEVGRVATIGAVATKSLALDSRQVVQEVRDLVQGGIQAASSTLATSLGLTDKDIKAAKQSSEGLFVFLEKRLEGYTISAMERQNTLGGAFDVLKMKLQRLFADEQSYKQFTEFVISVSNSIARVNDQTKKLEFNPTLVAVTKDYMAALRGVGTALSDILKVIGSVVGSVFEMNAAMGQIPLMALVAYIGYTKIAATSMSILTANVTLASLATNKLAMAFGVLGAAIAGYTIGKVLYEQFEEARKAGITFVAVMLKGLNGLRYGVEEVAAALQLGKAVLASGVPIAESIDAYKQSREAAKKSYEDQKNFIDDWATDAFKQAERVKENAIANKQALTAEELRIQRNQALTESRAEAAKYDDKLAKQNAYTAEVTKLANRLTVATSAGATEAEKAEAFDLYKRGLDKAKSDFEKSGLKEAKAARRKDLKDMSEDLKTFKSEYQATISEIDRLSAEGGIGKTQAVQMKIDAIRESYVKLVQEVAKTKPEYAGQMIERAANEAEKETNKILTVYQKEFNAIGTTINKSISDALGESVSELTQAQLKFEAGFSDIRKTIEDALLFETDPARVEYLWKLWEGLERFKNLDEINAKVRDFGLTLDKMFQRFEQQDSDIELGVILAGGTQLDEYNGKLLTQQSIVSRLSELQDQRNRLESEFRGVENGKEYQVELKKIDTAIRSLTKDQARLAAETDNTFGTAANRALKNYLAEMQDTGKQTEQLMGSAMRSVEDMLVSAFTGGSIDAKAIMKKLLADIIRMFAQQTIMVPIVAQLLGAVGGGQGGVAGAAGSLGGVSGGMNLLSAGNSIYGASQGGGVYGAFAGSSVGQSLGLSGGTLMGPTVTGEALGGTALTGLGSALPWIGAGIAVIAMLSSLGKGGTPHAGGIAFANESGVATPKDWEGIQSQFQDTQGTWQFAESDWMKRNNAELSKSLGTMAAELSTTFNSITRQYGAGGGYGVGVAFSSDGEDKTRGRFGISADGKEIFEFRKRFSKDAEEGMAEFSAMIPTQLLKALREVDLSSATNEFLDKSLQGSTDALTSLAEDQTNAILVVLQGGWLDEFLGQLDTATMSFDETAKAVLAFAKVAQLKPLFDALGVSIYEMGVELERAAGGVDRLNSLMSTYYDLYYSDSEQQANVMAAVTAEFDKWGAAVPKSMSEFKALVDEVKALGTDGADAYIALLSVSEAFASVHKESTDLTDLFTKLANSIFNLDKFIASIDDAISGLDVKEKLTTQLQYVEDKIVSVFDEAVAASASGADPDEMIAYGNQLNALYLESYNIRTKAIEDEINNSKKLVELGKNLKDYVANLRIGASSPESVLTRLTEAQDQARGLYAVMTNVGSSQEDREAAGSKITSVVDTILDLAQQQYASTPEYAGIFNEWADLLDNAGSSLTEAEKQTFLQEEMVGISKETRDRLQELKTAAEAIKVVQNTKLSEIAISLGKSGALVAAIDSLPTLIAMNLAALLKAATPAYQQQVTAANTANLASSAANDTFYSPVTLQETPAKVIGDYLKSTEVTQDVAMAAYQSAISNGVSSAQLATTSGIAQSDIESWVTSNNLPAFAKGGVANGWSLVGENGPELANFSQPARIYTADDTRAMLTPASNDGDNEEYLKAVILELQALVRQNGAGTQAVIAELKQVKAELEEIRDKTRLKDAA